MTDFDRKPGELRRVQSQRAGAVCAAANGFTLIELILVISIIVVIAALAMPAVQRTIDAQSITKAGDRVRIAMGKARVQSIRTGEVHAMFYQQGGSWFNIAPLTDFQQQASLAQRRTQVAQNGRVSDIEDDLLPSGVRFMAGEVGGQASRSAAAMESSGADETMEMVLFYPDGSSQDAKLTLQNRQGELVLIELRGLTGLSRVLRIEPSQAR